MNPFSPLRAKAIDVLAKLEAGLALVAVPLFFLRAGIGSWFLFGLALLVLVSASLFAHERIAIWRDQKAKAGGKLEMRSGKVHQLPFKREGPKVGPNDPCPCGSEKKLKRCCRDPETAAPEGPTLGNGMKIRRSVIERSS